MQIYRMTWSQWEIIKLSPIDRDNLINALRAKVPTGYVLESEEPTGWSIDTWNGLAPHTHAIWKAQRAMQ